MVISWVVGIWTLAAFAILEFNYCCGERQNRGRP